MYVFLLCSDLDTLQNKIRFRNAVQKEENNQRSTAAVNPVWWYFSFVGPELPNVQTNDSALPPQTNYYSSFLYIALKTAR